MPQLVGEPARSKQSFTEIGRPQSAGRPSPKGPPPECGIASERATSSRAASARVHVGSCQMYVLWPAFRLLFASAVSASWDGVADPAASAARRSRTVHEAAIKPF